MGAALCVGAPQCWVRRVVGVGLVSVSTVCLAAVCRVSSSAAPLGGLLWWCLGGGLGLCGSWEGAGHAGLGWLGGGGARVWACVFALCSPRGPFLCMSLTPLFSLACLALFFFFFFLGGGWLGCRAWVWVCAGVGSRFPDRQGGWLWLLVSVRVAWPGVGVRVGVFVAWADGVVGSVGVVGLCGCRVCVRRRRSGLGWGTVGDAMGGGDAGDAYGGVL